MKSVASAHDAFPSVNLARVKRSYAPSPVRAAAPASNDARYATSGAPVLDRSALDAWARRAQAASGFGEAVAAESYEARRRAAFDLNLEARAARSATPIEVLAALVAAGASAWKRMAADWRRARDVHATERALRGIDRRTLRDIGLDSGESGSIAAELGGMTDRTRAHALMKLRYLAI
jgi:hypothetical protein